MIYKTLWRRDATNWDSLSTKIDNSNSFSLSIRNGVVIELYHYRKKYSYSDKES